MSLVERPERAPGLRVDEGVELPDDVDLGAYVTIHAGVVIAPGCAVQDRAVLGGTGSGALELAEQVAVCACARLANGVVVGRGVIVGDQAQVGEGAQIGAATVVGRGARVGPGARIGERCSIQTNATVGAGALVEDDAFLGPAAQAADRTRLRRACRIGAAARIATGLEVGEEAFLAAGAHVDADVPARAVMIGRAARHVRDVPDEDLLERWR